MPSPASSREPRNALACRSRRAEGFARQAPRRALEARLREQVATLAENSPQDGRRPGWVARRLRLSRRTVTRWRHQQRHACRLAPRGRPCKDASHASRRAVLEFLEREGTHLGLPALRGQFPHLPRCELRELQQAYREHYRATHRRSIERLTWHDAGQVWAMDHVHPPNPVDGVDRAVLSLRDLGSGSQLAWKAVRDLSALPAVDALHCLIREHGAPLLVKSDNGSAFKDAQFQQLLKEHEIVWLPSPARMPWYNGSCEAANGSLRTRTNHFAGSGGPWTSDCLEAARHQANELSRPQGYQGPTPSQRWAAHSPTSASQRTLFRIRIEYHRQQILAQGQGHLNPNNKSHQNQVFRQAVRRALLDLGLLTITRRSIPLPIQRRKRAKFS